MRIANALVLLAAVAVYADATKDDAAYDGTIQDVAREVAAALADAPVKSAHPLVRHLRAARVPSGDLRPRKATDEPPTTIEPFKFLADRPYLDGLLNILGVNPRSFMKA
ncbi:hypothetical protein AAVH_05710 [Aphelenchoides avenae]|nr:hypothetical protein AAVH_05710 [Aphelenchus avenae]